MFKKLFGAGESPTNDSQETASTLSNEEIQARIDSVHPWYHQIEIAPGMSTPGSHDSVAAFNQLDVPQDLRDMRVLDIGARDGFYSFEVERRGAEVLAVDSVDRTLTGFDVASSLLGSSVEWRTMNVYDLSPESVGKFDAVFFLGVLYHLRDPMLALDRIWDVTNPGARVWISSHVIDNALYDPETGEDIALDDLHPKLKNVPLAQFYPRDELGGSMTNCWGPNLAGLRAMVEAAGFAVQGSEAVGTRGKVEARRIVDAELSHARWHDRAMIMERKDRLA